MTNPTTDDLPAMIAAVHRQNAWLHQRSEKVIIRERLELESELETRATETQIAVVAAAIVLLCASGLLPLWWLAAAIAFGLLRYWEADRRNDRRRTRISGLSLDD